MRSFLLGFAALSLTACVSIEADPVTYPAPLASGSTFWTGLVPPAQKHVSWRLGQIETQPTISEGVLFLGDSITEGAPLSAMFPGLNVANHGIGWDTTEGVLLRLGQVTRNAPERLFLLIGTNDTNYTDSAEQISGNSVKIVSQLNAALPETEVYVISPLPRGGPGNPVLDKVNTLLAEQAGEAGYVYLDLAASMRAENGEMKPSLSYDNLHLNVHGYAVWEEVLRTCVWEGCPDGLQDPR